MKTGGGPFATVDERSALPRVSVVYYPALFEAFELGPLSLKNRIVMAPMENHYGTPNGLVTDRMIDYYVARAAGGVGLIIVELASVDSGIGSTGPGNLTLDHDGAVPGLARLATAIRASGAHCFIQIGHTGALAAPHPTRALIGPSPMVADPRNKRPAVKEMTSEDIADCVRRFSAAAARAVAAGFDGIEVHGAHGYLITEFLSAASNHRTDEYGGRLANRVRFLREIVAAIRRATPPKFPVVCRLSASEYAPGGITIEETEEASRWLEQAGVSAIHVSGGSYIGTEPVSIAPMAIPRGHMLWLAERIRKCVKVPVIAVGRLGTPADAERAITSGAADLVALGRALIADPDFANKARAGDIDGIVPCIACNVGCLSKGVFDAHEVMHCTTNPRVGRESESMRAARRPRSILVIGGGPAGIYAAITAVERGHAVTLCEQTSELGGQLNLSVLPPHKEELLVWRHHLLHRLHRSAVNIRLRTPVTAELVGGLRPDEIILAAGAAPRPLDLAGIMGRPPVPFDAVLCGRVRPEGRVIVMGGGDVACETADFILSSDAPIDSLAIVRRGARMADDMEPMSRALLLRRLRARGAVLLTGVRYDAIRPEGLAITTSEGRPMLLRADCIVAANGVTPHTDLAAAIGALGIPVHSVGDSVTPRSFFEAIQEAYEIASAM